MKKIISLILLISVLSFSSCTNTTSPEVAAESAQKIASSLEMALTNVFSQGYAKNSKGTNTGSFEIIIESGIWTFNVDDPSCFKDTEQLIWNGVPSGKSKTDSKLHAELAQDWIAIDLAGMCSDIENGYVCGFTGKNGSAVSLIFIDNINDKKSAENDLEDICSQAKSNYISSSDIESIVKEAAEIGYTVGVGLG